MGSIAENKAETLAKLEMIGHECGVFVVGRDRVKKIISGKMTESTYHYLVEQWVTAIFHALKEKRASENVKGAIEYIEQVAQ